jgi:hypothetical protein
LPPIAIAPLPGSTAVSNYPIKTQSNGSLLMKWAGMYLVGFIILVGGVMAALWKMGVLQRVGTVWTLIGFAILIGIGIMISVSNSGNKENIQIDRK